MKWKIVFATLIILPEISVFAQPTSNSLPATKWGAPIAGVHLSISLVTNVFERGSSAVVRTRIRNTSTNTVVIFHSGRLPHDFGVFLTHDSGKKFDLTPKLDRHPIHADFGSLNIDIASNAEQEIEVRIPLGKELPSGNYRLELTRDIHAPGNLNTNPVVSNPLAVELIKVK